MNLADFKAGRYENQIEYKSFLPAPIHHEWLTADAEVLQLLGQADRALGELNAFAQLIPNIDFFISSSLARNSRIFFLTTRSRF